MPPLLSAGIQLLKVEIGGDTQSTEGTEASHMRSKDDGNTEAAFNRGYVYLAVACDVLLLLFVFFGVFFGGGSTVCLHFVRDLAVVLGDEALA